jgi:putative DNA primase/helicase
MKNAPNLNKQPADKFTEQVIFAGKDAWVHAKDWQQNNRAGDSVPPVVLAARELANLSAVRIIGKGRRFARVCRAGALSELHISMIATRLALAGVQEARFYSESHELLEDWSPRLTGLKAEAERGESAALSTVATCLPDGADLARMAASERGKVLAAYYGGVAVNPDNGAVYQYQDGIWQRLPDTMLRRTLAAIFDAHETPYNPKGIDAAVESMRITVPVLPTSGRAMVAFINGVYDLSAGQFLPHSPENGLLHHNGILFTDPQSGENLRDHAPCFHRWLVHVSSGDADRAERICAALFMVLANRHDWQLFIEVTGEGGSGKSVFTAIASLLVGMPNIASGNMKALDEARGRAQFVGKSLIILPDQPRYTGEGTGIKAVTGGDPVEIDGKYEKQYTTVLKAVVLATNNEPMIFTERNGGIARRRVIFSFDNPVSEADKDPALVDNIAPELPVIIRHLLTTFCQPDSARERLHEQRDSAEALSVKRGTDPVIDLCAALYFMSEPKGLMMGGGTWAGQPEPKAYLYHCYLAFMEYHGLGRPLSVEKFSRAMKQAAKEYRAAYLTRKINGRTQTNVNLNEQADEFLPRAWGSGSPVDPPA